MSVQPPSTPATGIAAPAEPYAGLPPPLPLLIAYAPKRDRAWHALCWQIDALMARTVLGKKEGAVAAIRLAWWEEALTGAHAAPNDPLLQQWQADPRSAEASAAPDVACVAGAWRMLLDPAPMDEGDWRRFGEWRGRLFALISGETAAEIGALWALWDMAGRDLDRVRAEGAFAAAIEMAERIDTTRLSRTAVKPLVLAAGMAADDVREGRMPDGRFGWRQYLRLLRRAIFA